MATLLLSSSIALCPLLMVAISFALGAVITALISRSNNFQEFVFCSNLNASDPVLHVPITNISLLPTTPRDFYIPGMSSDSQGVKHTNYFDTATGAALSGGAANSNLGSAGSRLIGKPACEIMLGSRYSELDDGLLARKLTPPIARLLSGFLVHSRPTVQLAACHKLSAQCRNLSPNPFQLLELHGPQYDEPTRTIHGLARFPL